MYILEPREKDAWLQLDNMLYSAARILKIKYDVGMLFPPNPWYMGYLKPHAKFGTLRLCLQKSRDCFIFWMGLLSFLIANAEASCDNSPQTAEQTQWMSVLQDHGMEFGITAAWVDALCMSPICSFSPKMPRTGTFLRLPPQPFQPSVEWFCSFNIPVWYPWGKSQMGDPSLAHLAPPLYMMQESHTFFMVAPSAHEVTASDAVEEASSHFLSGPAASDTAVEAPSGFIRPTSFDAGIEFMPNPVTFNNAVESTKPQVSGKSKKRKPVELSPKQLEFFNARAALNAAAIIEETPLQRQQRKSREANRPPASKRGATRVFEWTSDYNGNYERVEVPAKSREDLLGDHSSEQFCYDPVQNEYDVCADWGRCPIEIEEDEETDDTDQDEHYFGGDDISPEAVQQMANQIDRQHAFNEARWEPTFPSVTNGSSNDSVAQGSSGETDRLESNARMVMRMWFGFSPTAPLSIRPAIQTEKDQKAFCRILGWPWDTVKDHRHLFSRPFIAAAAHFFDCLSKQPSSIDPQDWDLNRFNHSCLVNTHCFSCLRILASASGRKVYMFDFGNARTVRWNLALKTASEALVVCRLDIAMDERDIAQFLVDYGIPFHTLQPSSSVVRTPRVSRPPMKIPVRNDAHLFTADDYVMYRSNCYYMLRHPRGRAALMYSTYVGRIAQNIVPLESVFDGPSGWSMDAAEMFVVMDPVTGIEYIDDQLTEDEKIFLTGRYDCYTGMFFLS